LKGKWSIRQRHRFHSTPSVLFTLCRYSAISPIGIIIHLYFFYQWGRKDKRAHKVSVLAINPKGGEILSPKQKDRTTTFRKILIDIFQIGMFIFSWLVFSKLASKYILN
jgi:hypothetical protein